MNLRGREFRTPTLTLYQPWASLMALGVKKIETRSWSTPHRGLLAIHSSRTFNQPAREFSRSDVVAATLSEARIPEDDPLRAWPLGVVLCTVELTDVVPAELVPLGGGATTAEAERLIHQAFAELAFGDFSAGRFAWITRNVHRFQRPVYAVGQRGVWTWEHSGSQLRPRIET